MLGLRGWEVFFFHDREHIEQHLSTLRRRHFPVGTWHHQLCELPEWNIRGRWLEIVRRLRSRPLLHSQHFSVHKLWARPVPRDCWVGGLHELPRGSFRNRNRHNFLQRRMYCRQILLSAGDHMR